MSVLHVDQTAGDAFRPQYPFERRSHRRARFAGADNEDTIEFVDVERKGADSQDTPAPGELDMTLHSIAGGGSFQSGVKYRQRSGVEFAGRF